MSASSPTERALRVLAILQSGRLAGAPELAERLGVDTRTVRRDIERLRRLGYRLDASAGPGGGYRLAAADRLPPLQLDAGHAEAVAVALHVLGASEFAGLADDALATLEVLNRLLPPTSASRVAAVASSMSVVGSREPGIDREVYSGLTAAIAEGRRIRFDYRDRRGTASERSAEPIRVVRFARHWYLFAFDLDRDDWRTFRLDRMSRTHVTTFGVRRRDVPDPVAAVRRSVLEAPYTALARLRLRGEAATRRRPFQESASRGRIDEAGRPRGSRRDRTGTTHHHAVRLTRGCVRGPRHDAGEPRVRA